MTVVCSSRSHARCGRDSQHQLRVEMSREQYGWLKNIFWMLWVGCLSPRNIQWIDQKIKPITCSMPRTGDQGLRLSNRLPNHLRLLLLIHCEMNQTYQTR